MPNISLNSLLAIFHKSISVYILKQIAFTPDNAVDGLTGGASNCTHRERLGCFLGSTVVACSNAFFDNLHLAIESSGATLDQGYISCQAHLIDVPARFEVIQSIESNAELLEPGHSEFVILDIGMVCDNFDIGIKPFCCLLSHLRAD